ncbi:hypothetical protein [Pseudotabrizicola formosa]|uniref:hypothetical protein n=1 Tax=Pseudotabrizicola formosa TaxID=2030009 RepID=UPI0011AF6D88|nr:hypothetical protein [Pseudotabrizicola formosa]
MMIRPFSKRAILALMFSLPLLAACVGGAAPDRLNLVDPDDGFSRVWRDYPDLDARYARSGRRDTLSAVRMIATGQDAAMVEAAIGKPVLISPDAGMAEYNLSLSLTGQDRLVCQYRIYYDAQGKVQGSVWRRPQCADLITGRVN